jgi:hypothetical protein
MKSKLLRPERMVSRRRSFLGRWPGWKLAAAWCVTVAAFTWYGGTYGAESAAVWACFGVGVSTCLVAAVGILSMVHTRFMGKIEAIVWLAVSSVATPLIVVTATIWVSKAMGATGDDGFALAKIALWTVTIAGGTFLMFTPIVIGIGKPPREPRG